MDSQHSWSDRRPYDSDITDAQWSLVEDRLPATLSNRTTGGRPQKYARRELFNAILYVVRTGCQWRLLPHDLPLWQTVYRYFSRWHADGMFDRVNTRLRERARIAAGRDPEPTAGIIDSQSVKIVANIGFSGFDGGKKVNGRKRHIVVETLGLLLSVSVHEASRQDRAGAYELLARVKATYRRVAVVFADQGYTGDVRAVVKEKLDITLNIVKRAKTRVFEVLRRRWVVERTFAWFGFYRRLSKDYERHPAHSEAFVYLAMSALLLQRLCPVEGF